MSPKITGQASHHRMNLSLIKATGTDFRRTDWMLVAREPAAFLREPFQGATSIPKPIPGLQAWTDDFNNLFDVLK